MINQGQLWMPDFNTGQLGTVVAALSILGIKELIEKNEPMRASDRHLQDLRDFVLANRAAVKSILGLQFRADAKPIVILRRLVGKLGLKLKYLGRDGSGVRARIYQIVGHDDGRDMIFASWKSLDESKSTTIEASTNGINILLKPKLDVDVIPHQEVGDDDRDAASWAATIKGYAVRVIECFASGVGAVVDALHFLDWEQKWGVMLALDQESPSIFAQFVEAFPNWVEWCNA